MNEQIEKDNTHIYLSGLVIFLCIIIMCISTYHGMSAEKECRGLSYDSVKSIVILSPEDAVCVKLTNFNLNTGNYDRCYYPLKENKSAYEVCHP